MENFILFLVLLLLIVLALVIAFVYINKSRKDGGAEQSEKEDKEKLLKSISAFIRDDLSEKKLIKINTQITSNLYNADSQTTRLNKIYDFILHSYIYSYYPNDISGRIIKENLRRKFKLNFPELNELKEKVRKIYQKNQAEETKVKMTSSQLFRNYQIEKLKQGEGLQNENLQNLQSQKQECQHENVLLQEKIYSLRRDLEQFLRESRLRNIQETHNLQDLQNLQVLKERLEECQRQQTQHNQDLEDCRMIVNTLSNTS